MQHKSFKTMPCPIARSLARVGEWWSMLILRDALHGMTRFDQFQKSLGIAPNMLTRRLNALVEAGLLSRRRYSEKPPRDEYLLTARGRDFRPVLLALLAWGNRHFAPEGASVLLVDAKTGAAVDPMLVDPASGRPIDTPDSAPIAGPAAGEGTPRRSPWRANSKPLRRTANAASERGRPYERRGPRRNRKSQPTRGCRRCASRAQSTHARVAARADRSDPVADGVAQCVGHGGAGGHRIDRNLVRIEARHRRARGHGARLSRRHADANDLRRRHGRRHLVCDRARARPRAA